MVMKILVAILALAVLALMRSSRKQKAFVRGLSHFMYLNSCAYKELADSVTTVEDLAEFRSRFAEMKDFMREQFKEVGAPVDDWDKEMQ